MKKAVLITGHYWKSKRRAGFHWLADAYERLGWEVLFFTAPLSWLSWLRRDYRLTYPELWRERNQLVRVRTRLWSFIWFTPFHPANMRSSLLNRLSYPLFSRYSSLSLGEAEEFVKKADLFVFESTPGLLLFERLRRLNGSARFVYRVSDDLRLLRNHPVVLEAEAIALPSFDLVSVPSPYFKRLFLKHDNLKVHPHAIRKDVFDCDYPNPYIDKSGPHIVFVGISYFDTKFLEIASRLFPAWTFHVIGPIPGLPQRPNIIAYGEMPFLETVPFIKYADVGLAAWSYRPGAESLSDSLKIIQYTYCQLPIVAPAFLKSERPNIIPYEPGNPDSIRRALESAVAMDRCLISREGIWSWEELATLLCGGTNSAG